MPFSLQEQVAAASAGQLRLVDTLDRGRCLEAVVDITAGRRWRDLPVVPHGSSLGKYLIEACDSKDAAEIISSVEFLAALDFLASLLFHLRGESEVLNAMYSFGEPEKVSMIRRWHQKWRSDLTEDVEGVPGVTVSQLEEAWRHVIPNWRQLSVSCPCQRWVNVDGLELPALSHDTVCGLWLQMALCEHSCDPNCCLVHDGNDLWFVALRDISQGSPITTSYLNVEGLMKPTHLRQQELREVWGFDCACSRCKEDRIQFLPPKQLQRLLISCSLRPPDLPEASEGERQDYSDDVQKLLEQVKKLHGPSVHSPAEQALLLMQSIFAPKVGHEDACRRHWESCVSLFGAESPLAIWAEELCQSPQSCAEHFEAGGANDPRDVLLEAYARYFASKKWARKRRGGEFIACSSGKSAACIGRSVQLVENVESLATFHGKVAAAEVNRDLVAGSSARIRGLRSAAELNGRVVQLQKFDEATHRWIVSLQDGSVKSIRAQNLDPLDMPSAFEAAPRHRQARSEPVQPVVQPAAPETAECLDREELKRLAQEMLASAGEQASDEVLNALNVEDLLELVNTLQIDSSAVEEDVTASAGYPPDHPVPCASSTSSTSSRPPQAPETAEPRRQVQSERERLELEEARLQSLAEAQSQRARELEAREEALREAEERLEKRRAEVDAAREEQKEPVPVRIPFVLESDMSPATQALEEERAELQRLREEVEAAAKEMEVQQQAAKQRAEERELQFLEEQMQMASTLKEEEARLEMQRRSLGMLQQALFKGATASAQNGYMEHSLNDEDAQEHREQGPGQAAGAGKVSLADDSEGDEVWDLDWSAVSAAQKDQKASTSSEPAKGETT
ncbi:unnamed protein product [Cladocopium goreaui]|uniref:Histone-lysine N-methyltransferase SMYD3 n=1 Tax=Cladocopium goreaui TaxID=2562237 RepID=A0A9P1FIM9_9DINO|nr:unnamed protein product [Cladocopium goreaui]